MPPHPSPSLSLSQWTPTPPSDYQTWLFGRLHKHARVNRKERLAPRISDHEAVKEIAMKTDRNHVWDEKYFISCVCVWVCFDVFCAIRANFRSGVVVAG